MNKLFSFAILAAAVLIEGCSHTSATTQLSPTDSLVNALMATSKKVIKPAVITEPVAFDTDDPAIWINPEDPSKSLIIGTDKDENGGLYVFDLAGKIIHEKTVRGLKRPDNVDIEYGLILGEKSFDIVVATERITHKLRIYSLPDMKPLDDGGIPMFEGETGEMYRDLMGIALYKNPATQEIFAIVGRKNGPTDGTYLWQYRLEDNGKGSVRATLVRKFGQYSGRKEIEAIAVDNELGYVYYSDEGFGVRKYYADPSKGNEELALLARTGFRQDHEGISIYKINNGSGYILISDQQANQFFIYTREGSKENPHDHKLLKIIKVAADESDGSDVTNANLNAQFRNGMFVVMSTDKTFHFYKWEDIAGGDLMITPDGVEKKVATK